MDAQPSSTFITSDGLLAVLIKTEDVLIPHGNLAVTTSYGRKVFVKVISGIKRNIVDVEQT